LLTIQLAHSDDTPGRFYVGGKLAAAIKEYVCTMVVKQIAKESRKPGSYSWPGDKKLPAVAKPAVR
jgi:NADH dehydrogenase